MTFGRGCLELALVVASKRTSIIDSLYIALTYVFSTKIYSLAINH
jgi:hypothetical protein